MLRRRRTIVPMCSTSRRGRGRHQVARPRGARTRSGGSTREPGSGYRQEDAGAVRPARRRGLGPGGETMSDTPDPMPAMKPRVGIIMGSRIRLGDDAARRRGARRNSGCPEVRIVSAHRTPGQAAALRRGRRSAGHRGHHRRGRRRGASAGHVRRQDRLPVLGVPVESAVLRGVDSLLSIVQMPGGVPVATLAIGKAGAINAALLAAAILGTSTRQFGRRSRRSG